MDLESELMPPEWLQKHPELKARGIVLEDPLKPVSRSTSLSASHSLSLILFLFSRQ